MFGAYGTRSSDTRGEEANNDEEKTIVPITLSQFQAIIGAATIEPEYRFKGELIKKDGTVCVCGVARNRIQDNGIFLSYRFSFEGPKDKPREVSIKTEGWDMSCQVSLHVVHDKDLSKECTLQELQQAAERQLGRNITVFWGKIVEPPTAPEAHTEEEELLSAAQRLLESKFSISSGPAVQHLLRSKGLDCGPLHIIVPTRTEEERLQIKTLLGPRYSVTLTEEGGKYEDGSRFLDVRIEVDQEKVLWEEARRVLTEAGYQVTSEADQLVIAVKRDQELRRVQELLGPRYLAQYTGDGGHFADEASFFDVSVRLNNEEPTEDQLETACNLLQLRGYRTVLKKGRLVVPVRVLQEAERSVIIKDVRELLGKTYRIVSRYGDIHVETERAPQA